MAGGTRPGLVLSRTEFDQLFTELCVWGQWGTDDALGSLNYLTPERTAAAAASVRTGRSVGLGHTLDTVASADNPTPAVHTMTELPARRPGDATTFSCDGITIECHGDAHSHIDSLCHVSFHGQLYNGIPDSIVTTSGAARLDVALLRNGIVGRGVLLDIAGTRNVAWLQPGDRITAADLDSAEQAGRVRVGDGDIVLVRTGHYRRRSQLGPWDAATAKAGLDPRAMRWLAERHVAVLGADGDSDTMPGLVEGVSYPVHVLAMCALGIPLLDCLNLEDLASACTREDRWDFLLTVAPLVLRHGTGTPVNPIAVF
jgi:kynurenine formamidase